MSPWRSGFCVGCQQGKACPVITKEAWVMGVGVGVLQGMRICVDTFLLRPSTLPVWYGWHDEWQMRPSDVPFVVSCQEHISCTKAASQAKVRQGLIRVPHPLLYKPLPPPIATASHLDIVLSTFFSTIIDILPGLPGYESSVIRHGGRLIKQDPLLYFCPVRPIHIHIHIHPSLSTCAAPLDLLYHLSPPIARSLTGLRPLFGLALVDLDFLISQPHHLHRGCTHHIPPSTRAWARGSGSVARHSRDVRCRSLPVLAVTPNKSLRHPP